MEGARSDDSGTHDATPMVGGVRVNAVFHNGVLTVTVPKGPEAKAATIPIKVE